MSPFLFRSVGITNHLFGDSSLLTSTPEQRQTLSEQEGKERGKEGQGTEGRREKRKQEITKEGIKNGWMIRNSELASVFEDQQPRELQKKLPLHRGTRTLETRVTAVCVPDPPARDSVFAASLTTATLLRKPAEKLASLHG